MESVVLLTAIVHVLKHAERIYVLFFFFQTLEFCSNHIVEKRYNITYLNNCTMTNLRDWGINEDVLILWPSVYILTMNPVAEVTFIKRSN